MDRAHELSLYFELTPGEKADAETISRAVLAFAAALRKTAYIMDPQSGIRLELVGGEEGSLNLKSVLKIFTSKGAAIAVGVGVMAAAGQWLKREGPTVFVTLGIEQAVDLIKGDNEIDDEEARRIAVQLAKIAADKEVNAHVKEFYREVAQDPTIRGVGLSRSHEEIPSVILNRSEIQDRAGLDRLDEAEPVLRPRNAKNVEITVVMPALIAAPKKWRIIGPEGDSWALMSDAAFLEKMAKGETEITLGANVRLLVDLQYIEEKVDGIWRIKERFIMQVHSGRNIGQIPLGLNGPPDPN